MPQAELLRQGPRQGDVSAECGASLNTNGVAGAGATRLQGLPGDLTQERALSRAVPGCPRDRDSVPPPTAPGDSLVHLCPAQDFSRISFP